METFELHLILKRHLKPTGILLLSNEVKLHVLFIATPFNYSLTTLAQWINCITVYMSDGSGSTRSVEEAIEVVRENRDLNLDLVSIG